MPEHFFHVRLDTGKRNSNSRGRNPRTNIFATPPVLAQSYEIQDTPTALETHSTATSDDWRSGRIVLQSVDMISAQSPSSGASAPSRTPQTTTTHDKNGTSPLDPTNRPPLASPLSKRIANSPGTTAPKARFEPADVHETDVGWGVVRVFRDIKETPGLYEVDPAHSSTRINSISSSSRLSINGAHPSSTSTPGNGTHTPVKDSDCCTLAILAVPGYMSPADFMGWVGAHTRAAVSHFRMIKTERANRYMVLMRFRSGKTAREWRTEWNGKSFDQAEAETAQVVFVKSIEFMGDEGEDTRASSSFPEVEDPFGKAGKTGASVTGSAMKSKPLAPPTPNLIEMPTCPVCLERMDESTGLLTIQCQHVFHCSCLHKWRGSGCPVCRFTHDGLAGRRILLNGQAGDDPDSGPNECSICHSEDNLWICLICGNIGCGRYDAAHAFMHWEHSGHAFSMDMSTQRIWDYNGDGYVHRIVQNKLDGKIMEMPEGETDEGHANDSEGYVPREKNDAIGREYTALLTSQLESQRAYYEEKVSLAADKASQASLAATQAAEAASHALDQLTRLQESHRTLVEDTIPLLEKDRERTAKKADKAQEMARKFEKEWREEKAVNQGLMERVKKLDEQMGANKQETETTKAECEELREMNRDLQFFISGQEKIKELEEAGEGIAEGSVSVPEERKKAGGKRRKKGKGKEKDRAADG